MLFDELRTSDQFVSQAFGPLGMVIQPGKSLTAEFRCLFFTGTLNPPGGRVDFGIPNSRSLMAGGTEEVVRCSLKNFLAR